MKTVITMMLLPVLVACGSGTSEPLADQSEPANDVFSPAGPTINACASDYYTELVGDYDGQISYSRDDGSQSCTWEVELQITSGYSSDPATRAICDLSYNMASTGATEGCSDIGTGGKLLDNLVASSEQWTNTPWPVDASASMSSAVSESLVYPIGFANLPSSQFTIRFDGLGNVKFPDSDELMPEWTGVLVKE